jgi:hypothetical protein
MTERYANKVAISQLEVVVPNALQVDRGNVACLQTSSGAWANPATSATLVPMGHWKETVLGDAVKTCIIELFEPLHGYWYANDGTNPVTTADLGKPVYLMANSVVRILSTGSSILGRAYKVSATDGVFVVPAR